MASMDSEDLMETSRKFKEKICKNYFFVKKSKDENSSYQRESEKDGKVIQG